MRKLEVTFDFDGVLSPTNEVICELVGVNFEYVDIYNINKATRLTEKQKADMIKCYCDAKCFEIIGILEEASRLKEIQDTGKANVNIHSLSWSNDVASVKRQILHNMLPWMNDSRIILEINGVMSEKTNTDTDILVEDCITNIVESKPRELGILIDKPYNKPERYGIDIRDENISIVKNLNTAIDKILEEIQKWG